MRREPDGLNKGGRFTLRVAGKTYRTAEKSDSSKSKRGRAGFHSPPSPTAIMPSPRTCISGYGRMTKEPIFVCHLVTGNPRRERWGDARAERRRESFYGIL